MRGSSRERLETMLVFTSYTRILFSLDLLIPDHWFIMYGPMPRRTRCKFLDLVELVKTSLHVASPVSCSIATTSQISLSWFVTSS
jgi:hypothetical protein